MSSSSNATMESCLEFASKIVSSKKEQKEYAEALLECRRFPAYHIQLKSGDTVPLTSYPLVFGDNGGWTTVKRKIRVKKLKSNEQLDEDADLDNWEDVEHYGRATYTQTGPVAEHNGALFDIGARF
jgi:hypothetical protein